MADISEDKVQEVSEAVLSGRKIEAIKLYNEATGAGLKESKAYVDALEQQLRQGSPASFGRSRATAGLPEDKAREMTEEIFAGRKIQAIKMYREAMGVGLKESKEFIDELTRQLREECPERFSASAKAGCGAVVMFGAFLSLAAGYGVATFW